MIVVLSMYIVHVGYARWHDVRRKCNRKFEWFNLEYNDKDIFYNIFTIMNS